MRKLCFIFFIILHHITYSATYTVTNTNNSGAGSLREALTNANNLIGSDIIVFNISTSDLNYNSSNGTWTITLLTILPYITTGYITIDGNSQSINQGNTNPNGPEIIITSSGLDYAFLIASPNNSIKDFVITGFVYGVQLYSSNATNNTITNCYIGTNHAGNSAVPNEYGITISNHAIQNTISANLISGNTSAGIIITDSDNNIITSNKIGTNKEGNSSIPNNDGIIINNSAYTKIGDNGGNLISGNSNVGITLNGNFSIVNTIKGNYIGTDINGEIAIPNFSGIFLINSAYNIIGGNINTSEKNVISGNLVNGILLNGTGTRINQIIGNCIGTNIAGTSAISNQIGITIKSNANNNTIGNSTSNGKNVISGNFEIGIYIEASDSNKIKGNIIGPDITGMQSFSVGDSLFQANGVEFNTVSKNNILGGPNPSDRNIVSGNRVYGVIYYGNCYNNSTVGNYIGTDITGSFSIPNATGICVDGGSNYNRILSNLISGNISYGIFIVTNQTFHNEFKGNIVGLNATGTDTIPNDVGLLIGGGASYNNIGFYSSAERNIFSGNRYAGIEIADIYTNNNNIRGNYIGTDITGNIAFPNYNGIVLTSNTKKTSIDSNLISGNNGFGIVIHENADSNTVYRNKIGTNATGNTNLGNKHSGILISNGAKYNNIGFENNGNIIAYNDSSGILLMDNNTLFNTISANSIHHNNFLSIDIKPWGVNQNDIGDFDTGPNNMMNFPIVNSASWNSLSEYNFEGTIDCQSPESCIVEIFGNTYDSPTLYGDGEYFLGYTYANPDGNWTFTKNDGLYYTNISATATDISGNTSEFSLRKYVILVSSENIENKYNIFSIYPNPSKGRFSINSNTKIFDLKIYNVTGEIIYSESNINKSLFEINTSLFKGIYYVSINNHNYKKLIID